MYYGNTELFLSREEREALIHRYLGKTVEVVIDRPIGYVHFTKGVRLDYTVNYGFLPGIMGGDGEEQDVYILGVAEPLERFTGRIAGVVRRRDDNEDKFIALPEGVRLHQGEMAEAIHFVEKYFDSRVESLYHKSCGVIPFRRGESGVEFLLVLQKGSGFWSVPKGHMEAFETEQDTALRELNEEIGVTADLLPDFRTVIHYPLPNGGEKDVVLFLGAAEGKIQTQEAEVLEHRWVTPGQAAELLGKTYAESISLAASWLKFHG